MTTNLVLAFIGFVFFGFVVLPYALDRACEDPETSEPRNPRCSWWLAGAFLALLWANDFFTFLLDHLIRHGVPIHP